MPDHTLTSLIDLIFYPITFLKTLSPTLVHICNPMTWEVEAEDQKFKVILDYIMSSKAAWDTFYQKNVMDDWRPWYIFEIL